MLEIELKRKPRPYQQPLANSRQPLYFGFDGDSCNNVEFVISLAFRRHWDVIDEFLYVHSGGEVDIEMKLA